MGCKEKFSDYDTRKKGFMICTYGGKAKGYPDAKDLEAEISFVAELQ